MHGHALAHVLHVHMAVVVVVPAVGHVQMIVPVGAPVTVRDTVPENVPENVHRATAVPTAVDVMEHVMWAVT